MKITVVKENEVPEEFPVILENQRSGLVILVTGWQTESKSSYKGFCIRKGDSEYELGKELYWSREAFTVFKGKLIIEQ